LQWSGTSTDEKEAAEILGYRPWLTVTSPESIMDLPVIDLPRAATLLTWNNRHNEERSHRWRM
jgi:hypothetical protein